MPEPKWPSHALALAFGGAGQRPADPVAQRLAHYEVKVAPLQPRQFVGEEGHTLPPGAGHAGDVGAPEHPLGAERIKAPVQMRVQAAERVFVLGIAGLSRRLDRYIRLFSEGQQFRLVAISRLAFTGARHAHMVDDQLQAGVALGDLADCRQKHRRPQRHRHAPLQATASRACRR